MLVQDQTLSFLTFYITNEFDKILFEIIKNRFKANTHLKIKNQLIFLILEKIKGNIKNTNIPIIKSISKSK